MGKGFFYPDTTCRLAFRALADSRANAGETLHEHRHISRQQKGWPVFGQVLGVDEVALRYARGVLLAECIERRVRLVARQLDLDGTDLCTSLKQEVYLVIVLFVARPGVIVELVSRRHQHLRHQIFVDIAKVGGQGIRQQLFIDDIIGEALVQKSVRCNGQILGCFFGKKFCGL